MILKSPFYLEQFKLKVGTIMLFVFVMKHLPPDEKSI
jgi:hypothetical protein